MKQKRKVKSLISSKSDSSVLLSVLLFLVGGILVFGAVALFTSLVGVASAQGEGDAFEYENGIEDKVEVLLNLKFASDGLSNTVNEMYFSGNTFYMKGNDGISRDVPAGGSIDGYVNYLGGEWDGMIISSDNVTIIGGKSVKVFENNANTTILGGLNNVVDKRNTAGSVAPVMLGGQNNTIGENQLGSAIVGGSHNTISNNGSYDFILGGENNTINGENVIVGGSKVTVNGKSNVFVFNDGETTFTPQGSNTFYLYLKNGLGLNKAAVNKGVDSKGSVSFGSISIGMLCEDEDVGVQGRWEGCLVGCTYRSATNGKKWEMIDHGDTCEEKCKNNPTRCMVDPIEPTPPADYTSECTVGGVDTGHSTQCAANRLGVYENVMFETFLIDSDDDCANYDTHQNKCIFKCDKDYHLTGNIAGGSSATKKCYKDCTLPWNGEKIKHNVKVDAYNAKTVACSNTEWVFPLTTAIVNVPNTSEYTLGLTINGMVKARVGNGAKEGHSYESCTNYSHKKTLVCYDGELYIANTNGTKTNTKALGNIGAWYGYDVCTTKDYKCPTSVYNLTQSYITTNSIAKDTVTRNNTDRSTSMGTRGQYKLCLDWTPSVGNSECKVGRNGANGTPADSYHYQLVKCNTHYSTGTDNNPYECKKSCSIKNLAGNVTRTDNNGREYKHNTVITGYKINSVDCTINGDGKCQEAKIICDDGVWKMGTKTGPENTQYLYNDCKLNAYVCNARFDISQANKNSRQSSYPHSEYEACTPYNPSGRFLCVAQTDKFDLIGCNPTDQYHTENNKYCISNSKTVNCTNAPSYSTYEIGFNKYAWNGTWNAGSWVHTYGNCNWWCNSGRHLESGSCLLNSKKYKCSTTYTKPEHSEWDHEYEEWEWFGDWDDGSWSKQVSCTYSCDPKYEGDDCDTYIPDGCSSVCGNLSDGESCESYDRCDSTKLTATCTDGQMVGEQGSELSPNAGCNSCTGCPGRTYVSDGGTCTSYDQCSTTQKTATCDDGRWSGEIGDYSGPNQGCPDGCDRIGVCPAASDGGKCTTYKQCSTVSRTITCNGGSWEGGTPYDYLEANQGCGGCDGCPTGSVAHEGKCESYAKCSNTKVTSLCSNTQWNITPEAYSLPNQDCPGSEPECTGSYPSGATPSSATPTTSKDWFCATDTTQACSYTCPTGQECNGTSGCKTKKNSMVDCGEEEYTCEGTGATMTYDDNMSSTEWKWKCTSEDGSTTKSCSKSCGEGETLQWSSLHNGSCVKQKVCKTINPYISSSCSAGTCGLGFSANGTNDQQSWGAKVICEGDTLNLSYCVRGTGTEPNSCTDPEACSPECFPGGELPEGALVNCIPSGWCDGQTPQPTKVNGGCGELEQCGECARGTVADYTTNWGEDESRCEWTCKGSNGGTDEFCSMVLSCNNTCSFIDDSIECTFAYGSNNECAFKTEKWWCEAEGYVNCSSWPENDACKGNAGFGGYVPIGVPVSFPGGIVQTVQYNGPCCSWNQGAVCKLNGVDSDLGLCDSLVPPNNCIEAFY